MRLDEVLLMESKNQKIKTETLEYQKLTLWYYEKNDNEQCFILEGNKVHASFSSLYIKWKIRLFE